MPGMSGQEFLKMLAQLRKGAYTNDPADPNYQNHWRTVRPAEEPVVAVYPGTARNTGRLPRPKQMVNVVQTASGYYVDTPSVERVGPFARVAGRVLDTSGMSTPFQMPVGTASIEEPRPNRLVISAPSQPLVMARTDGFVGRPADLSAGDQLRNLTSFFRR